MKKTDNKLFAQQAELMIRNLQEPETFKNLFLPLVVEAKETAHKNLMEQSAEYREASTKAYSLYEHFREKLRGSSLLDEFDAYIEVEDNSDTIWAEEMYLRGIQDAITCVLLTSKENIFDVTKLTSLL